MDRIGPSKPFRHFIREWMEYRDLSQERIAERLDVEASTISKLLRGKLRLSDKWLVGFAQALNVEVADLFHDPNAPTAQELLDGLNEEDQKRVIDFIEILKKTG